MDAWAAVEDWILEAVQRSTDRRDYERFARRAAPGRSGCTKSTA
jgi:hypothetical protein